MDSTYEGLKPTRVRRWFRFDRRLDSTYEGLKQARVLVGAFLRARLDSTYEGLKRSRAGPPRARRAVWTVPMRA